MADFGESIQNFALQSIIHISTITMPMATKIGRMVTYHKGLPLIKLNEPSITRSCRIRWQTNDISPQQVPMTIKLGRMVSYLVSLLPINLLDPLVTWSCKITWQTKTIITPLSECLWQPILAGFWVTYLEGFLPIKLVVHLVSWSSRSRDKLKPYISTVCSSHVTYAFGQFGQMVECSFKN